MAAVIAALGRQLRGLRNQDQSELYGDILTERKERKRKIINS